MRCCGRRGLESRSWLGVREKKLDLDIVVSVRRTLLILCKMKVWHIKELSEQARGYEGVANS